MSYNFGIETRKESCFCFVYSKHQDLDLFFLSSSVKVFSYEVNRGVRLIDISLKTNEYINSLVLSALQNFS